MFKYNTSPMQPLTEESEPTSDVQQPLPIEPIHELSGQDAAIITRIKNIREVMESLRQRLIVEKDNLARERLEAVSMFTYQSTPSIPENCVPLRSFYSLPVSYNYNSAQSMWGHTLSVQDYEDLIATQNYEDNYAENFQPQPNPNYLTDTVVSDTYREHLQDVEKMCREEFNKMQESISSMRKTSQQSSNQSSDDDTSHRKRHGSNCKKHLKNLNKSHKSGHRHRSNSVYILPDDPPTLEEHRSHYYYHYSDLPPRRKYLNRSHDRMKVQPAEEFSGDSTETNGTLWHLDSPYESDYD